MNERSGLVCWRMAQWVGCFLNKYVDLSSESQMSAVPVGARNPSSGWVAKTHGCWELAGQPVNQDGKLLTQ